MWAALLLPRLAFDALLRQRDGDVRDEDAHRLALVSRDQARPLIVDAASRALAAGVRRGQSLAAAQALFPALRPVLHDSAQAQTLRALLASWAYGYSSQVSLREPDAVLIEIGGSLSLFGPWPLLERRWRAELAELGVTHRLAAAPTALGALALAQAQDGTMIPQLPVLHSALAGLRIGHCQFDAATVEALHGMGLRHLRDVLRLPRAGLIRRFGAELVDYLDRLRGDLPDPLPLYRPPDLFHARMEFDHEIESSEVLRFPLRRLIGDLCTFLRSRDGGVQQFDLLLEHDALQFKQLAPTRLRIGTQMPQRDPVTLFDLCLLRLQASTIPAPVRALCLRAEELPPFVPAARDLFDTRNGTQLDWPQLADRLRSRLGDEAVYRIEVHDDPRPEHAWRKQTRRSVRETNTQYHTLRRPGARPTWLLRRPLPLRGEPARILAGPERIESGWWDGGDLRRDYYVIETRAGQRAWAFRGIDDEAPWLLHGWFA
ncbi:MAG: Y-family DNA polymerase [Rudaea sp.]